MNRAKIFLVGSTAADLIPMEESDYVAESHLQQLLVDYPDLLPGDQLTPDDPRRWLLVAREMGVPGDTSENGRWSLDHLFLDQDGIPTFVECKRSSDTRARREVVAQMLDYAANGTVYWGPDRLRQAAAETAQARGRDLDGEVLTLLGVEPEDEQAPDQVRDYWERVEANLREGRVRLLFVADQTSRELRRLIEFLNAKMADVEVAAVEIKQYLGKDGHRAVVPRAIGVTERARAAKQPTKSSERITQTEFLESCSGVARSFFERLFARVEQESCFVSWGTKSFSLRTELPLTGKMVTFAYGWPGMAFDAFLKLEPHMDSEQVTALREQLLAYGIFEQRETYTLRTQVNDRTYDKAVEALELLLQTAHQLAEK